MKPGQMVSVADAFENERVMRVLSIENGVVYVCQEEEFELAKRENREPLCTGVAQEFIRSVIQP